jgi:hypothetical protein
MFHLLCQTPKGLSHRTHLREMMVDQIISSFSTIPPIDLVQLNYLFIFNHSIHRSTTIELTCHSNNFNHLIHWSKCILKSSNHLQKHHQIYHFNCANNSSLLGHGVVLVWAGIMDRVGFQVGSLNENQWFQLRSKQFLWKFSRLLFDLNLNTWGGYGANHEVQFSTY